MGIQGFDLAIGDDCNDCASDIAHACLTGSNHNKDLNAFNTAYLRSIKLDRHKPILYVRSVGD